MDYHLTWYKCCPHWEDVQWPWPGSIPQRSRSHNTFKGLSTHAGVRSITYVCIDILPSNLVPMLSSLRWCAVTLTRIHTSKVKVKWDIVRCYKFRTHFPSFFSQNNMFIYPRIFRLPINHLVFPIFPFLTNGSVQFWSGSTYLSGWEKNKMF